MTHWISDIVPCHLQLGQIDAARDMLREAEEIILTTDEQSHYGEIRRLRGRLHQAEGEYAQAEVCYREALEWSRVRGALLFELRAGTDVGRLWAEQGRRTEALRLLVPIYDGFTQGLGAPDLEVAREVLRDLVSREL
jgi:tetratricopeptide (TPR) repeat protein